MFFIDYRDNIALEGLEGFTMRITALDVIQCVLDGIVAYLKGRR